MRKAALKIISGVRGKLGSAFRDSAKAVGRIEAIRQAMLDCLGPAGSAAFPVLERRVSMASDVRGLWYLRPELMNALSKVHGEAAARDQIRDLSARFEGLLPRSYKTRPGSLGR